MERANVAVPADLVRLLRDLQRRVFDLERQLALHSCPDGSSATE